MGLIMLVPEKSGPQLILPRRTAWNPGAIDATIRASLHTVAGGVSPPIAITHRGRTVAAMRNRGHGPELYLPSRHQNVTRNWLGFDNFNEYLTAITSDPPQRGTWHYCKAPTSNFVGGAWTDFWTLAGTGGVGTYTGAAATARALTSADAGAMAVGPNRSPLQHFIVGATATANTGTATLLFYDRVLTYEACTISNVQVNMTNVATAQRYISAGEVGLIPVCTVQSLTGAAASNLTQLAYTDQDGNPGAAMPLSAANYVIPTAQASPTSTLGAFVLYGQAGTGAGRHWAMPLAAGDYGTQAIASYTMSANNSGTLCFALIAPLVSAVIEAPGSVHEDYIYEIPCMSRLYDGACVSALHYASAATAYVSFHATLETAWGAA